MISTLRPRQWPIHNLLSKLPCHLFTYVYVLQKKHIFSLMRDYSVLTCLNISVYFDYRLYLCFYDIVFNLPINILFLLNQLSTVGGQIKLGHLKFNLCKSDH
jgi:hypothetical protein